MRTCIKTIWFSLALSIISAVLTYVVSINIELGFICLNSVWISNSFALTVFGGIFTGFFVMLLCELQKYFHVKKETEQQLFYHVSSLYAQLAAICSTLENLNNHPNEPVNNGLLTGPLNTLKNESSFAGSLNYDTFKSTNRIYCAHTKLQRWLLEDLSPFCSNCVYLQIAINTDKIENLKKHGHEGTITSASPYTGKAIKKLHKQIEPLIHYVDEYLTLLNAECADRFLWPLKKIAVGKAIAEYKIVELNDYLE